MRITSFSSTPFPKAIATLYSLVLFTNNDVVGVHGQPVKVSAATTPGDFLVKGLGEIEPAFDSFDGQMYAGLIPTRIIPTNNNNKGDKQQQQDEEQEQEDVGQLSFWLFEPTAPLVSDSLVIWLNGGPGCSSYGAGLFYENGPVTTPPYPAGADASSSSSNSHDPLIPNPYSWTNVTRILYMEQPVGTGFASGPEWPQNEQDLARDVYFFLQNFLSIFSHLKVRLFFVGESYAGMYVPSIAHYIVQENKKQQQLQQQQQPSVPVPYINLAGIALANGWMNVMVQGPTVIEYAYWHGMIDSVTRDALRSEWESCRLEAASSSSKQQQQSQQSPPFHPFTVPDECGMETAVLSAAGAGLFSWGAPNTYDVTTWDTYPMLFDENSTISRFFNDPRVQDALHMPRLFWKTCMPGQGRRRRRRLSSITRNEQDEKHASVSSLSPALLSSHNIRRTTTNVQAKKLLDDDRPISVVPYVAELLDDEETNIRVLVYNGDRDMSCNAQGSEMLLNTMEWKGASLWADPQETRRKLWMVNTTTTTTTTATASGSSTDGEATTTTTATVAGYAKAQKGLEFVIVKDSGHLVPHNQPLVALDLVTRFVTDQSFGDVDLPIVAAAAITSTAATTTTAANNDNESFPSNKDGSSSSSSTLVMVAALLGFVAGVAFSRFYPQFQGRRRGDYNQIREVQVEERYLD